MPPINQPERITTMTESQPVPQQQANRVSPALMAKYGLDPHATTKIWIEGDGETAIVRWEGMASMSAEEAQRLINGE